jgi:nitrogen regulatory protein P-II 1
MKKIEAVISPAKLASVKSGLPKIGVKRMTILEAKNWSGSAGQARVFRGTEYMVDFLPMVKLEVVVDEDRAEAAIEVITKGAEQAGREDADVCVTTVERGNLVLA